MTGLDCAVLTKCHPVRVTLEAVAQPWQSHGIAMAD